MLQAKAEAEKSPNLEIELPEGLLDDQSYVDGLYHDPRNINLGVRMYTLKGEQTFEADGVIEREKSSYDVLRFCYQVCEFQETFNAPPHKCSFDFLNSLDLNKGCFLGQELTARTAYNGVDCPKMIKFGGICEKIDFFEILKFSDFFR